MLLTPALPLLGCVYYTLSKSPRPHIHTTSCPCKVLPPNPSSTFYFWGESHQVCPHLGCIS